MDTLSDLQKLQLDIFKEFIRVCRSLGLRYYMVEGTMLGAMRHRGFIPWDDDIDVAMPRKDYELFIEKAGEVLDERYKLTTHKDAEHYWMTAIIWDMTSKVELSNASETIVKNAWIDVIPLDGMPGDPLRQKLHYLHFYYYRALYQASHFSKIVNVTRQRPWYEKVCVGIFQKFGLEKLFNSRKIGDRLHRVMSKYDYDKCGFVMQLISDYKMRELMPKEWFGDGNLYEFETLEATGVSHGENYLSQLYGEYMKLPPESKRVGKHNAKIIKSDYREEMCNG